LTSYRIAEIMPALQSRQPGVLPTVSDDPPQMPWSQRELSAGPDPDSKETRWDPPPNPSGGRTLIVDAADGEAYPRPSAALKETGPEDQVFVRPGLYEDKIFVTNRPVQLIGAGRDLVQIFSRRGGPLYLQNVPRGLIAGMTFRYIGSDQNSAMNILDSTCTISTCRAKEGILSGIVIYGPNCRPSLIENEVCENRESGIFVFAGARPYIAQNVCYANHHFGIAVRDLDSRPDLIRNVCRDNMLSGMLLFHHASAMVLGNTCQNNHHWGIVLTTDCDTSPPQDELANSNTLTPNPRGAYTVSNEPLAEIGR
jgi:hypothetical protein